MAAGRRRRSWTRGGVLAVAVLATVGFAYLAVRGVRLSDLWSAFRTSNYWWAIPSLAVLAVAVVVRAVRWGILFRAGRRPPFEALAKALLVSYFFNAILPARAGELARIVDLKRRAGTSRAETSVTVVVERAYDVVALLVLLFVFAPWMPRLSWLRAAAILAAVVVAGVVAAAAILAISSEQAVLVALRPLVRLGVGADRVRTLAESVAHGLAGLREARRAAIVLLCTTLSWLTIAASTWLLMFGFDFHASFVEALLVVVAVNIAQILPALPSALGVFEAATVVALAAYGVPRTDALSYALVLHALNLFPFLIVGPLALGPRRFARTVRIDLEAAPPG